MGKKNRIDQSTCFHVTYSIDRELNRCLYTRFNDANAKQSFVRYAKGAHHRFKEIVAARCRNYLFQLLMTHKYRDAQSSDH